MWRQWYAHNLAKQQSQPCLWELLSIIDSCVIVFHRWGGWLEEPLQWGPEPADGRGVQQETSRNQTGSQTQIRHLLQVGRSWMDVLTADIWIVFLLMMSACQTMYQQYESIFLFSKVVKGGPLSKNLSFIFIFYISISILKKRKKYICRLFADFLSLD